MRASGAASRRRGGAEPDSSAAESGSAVVRSSSARSLEELEEESRRSHRGMSTPAQMATMATYSIALLSAPPLGVLTPGMAGAGWPGGGFHGPRVRAHG